ncbi:methyltransferase domain-containing protein [Pseudoduganella sp. SL102]|uniref:methyltransferase domain-containing protein n=1 Tax=Pseudoduganella sp. SL102 TaxID=2995154 RepID=UPI00248D12C0|nr:methyltransferase domain-containing protein [Pseudoduganella sp. SL102]WBS05686.1 methyltransferase domain-containing protein [Pseudoduganella sp. SL102]
MQARPPKLSAPIDVERVRALFSQPGRLRDAEFLRREIAHRMFERLQLVRLAPLRVLDAGCGGGADLATLQKAYAAAQIVGLDASLPMLDTVDTGGAKGLNRLISKLLPAKTGIDLVCGDFADLPLGAASVDLVWSNLALHWHPQPDRVFAEWRRVLRVKGLLMFSCFGPDSLQEVRSAFTDIDLAPHTLPFVDMHDFGDQLVEAGFSTPVMDMEKITVTYDDPAKLLADVRALGGNPLSTVRKGLLSRSAREKLLAGLQKQRRADGKIGLTFEVIYGHAFKPEARVTKDGEAIIRFAPRTPK